ncbi:sodium channel and clathrin linker 1 isoform X2 [Periplaneta americana]|uniref:sodium channel and clathrin linker 1 isoform X2 n=1 Tax=Periplaneta americana TaxID=6978 RepID=UPI0037E88A04
MDNKINIPSKGTIPSTSNVSQDSKQELIPPLLLEYETFIGALQKQIDFYKEKDSAVEMWHMALREVDSLEEQLKTHPDNRHADAVAEMKHDFSSAITMLETKLLSTRSSLAKEKAAREELEKKYEEILQENQNLTSALQSRQQELEEALQGQCATAKKLQEVEEKAKELEKKLQTSTKAENELELALTKCHEHIDNLVKKNLEARDKVSESVELAECAIAEKDAMLYREAQLREENAQLQKVMAGIIDEAGSKVKEEVEHMKQQYNKKLKVLLHDMKKLEDENKEKEQILQKEIFEKRTLEGELQKLQMESPLRERDMGEKMARMYTELADVRNHNMHLGLEKEDLRSQMDRLHSSHELEVAKMNMEHQRLAEQILTLEMQLHEENLAKNEAKKHVDNLTGQMYMLEQEIEKIRLTTRNELQDLHQQNTQQEHRELMMKVKEIQRQSAATAEELQHHLEKQRLMKTKYQKAVKTITDRFVKRIEELRSQANSLKDVNKKLEKELREMRAKINHKHSLKENTVTENDCSAP